MIRLHELLEVRRLGLTAVVGDEHGETWLRWVQAVEDETAELIGGELVLTTGRWHREPADSERFVRAMAGQGAAAIAIGLHRGGAVPPDLVRACLERGIPLVQIPAGVSCELVGEFATTLIVDRRGAALVELLTRQRALGEAAAQGLGLRALLDVAQAESPHRIWLATRGAVFRPTHAPDPSAAEITAVAAALGAGVPAREVQGRNGMLTLFPVACHRPGAPPRAHVVVGAETADIGADLRQAIEQTIVFLRARFAAEDALRVFRRRCEDELMRWIASDDATRGSVDGWMRALGIEPRGRVDCLVVASPRAAELRDALDDMADALEMPRITVSGREDVGVALLVGDRPAEAERAIARLRAMLAIEPGAGHRVIGTSSVIATDVADVTRAFIDARQVCRLEQLRDSEPVRAEPVDQPLTAMLLKNDGEARESLHAAVLAPLVDYDREHAADLVHTLDVFLSSNGQWAASAAALGVHVNTLRYRLRRAEEITGRSLTSMSDRVDFFIALRSRTEEEARTG